MADVLTAPAREPAPAPDLFGGELRAAVAPPRQLETPAQPARAAPRRRGISPLAVLLVVVAVLAALWAVWATKSLQELRTAKVPIAAVRLQPLIEEYVQAQAHSGTPEDQVMRQTRAFMTALDAELLKRGQDGTTVLVAEAVLSKNVPDVTLDVRKAVYAKVAAPGSRVAPPALGGVPPQVTGASDAQR